MDVIGLHQRATEDFAGLVAAVRPEQWDAVTPCAGWNVRDLVNHVVGEERWSVPLLAGRTIESIGTELDGDLLGDDPAGAAEHAALAAQAAVPAAVREERKVHLSYGGEDAAEYVGQLIADHLIHGWDLAAAIGADRNRDPELVAAVTEWFADREELYRSGGMIATRPDGDWTTPQDTLLVAFGRDPGWTTNHAVVVGFGAATARCDVDAMMALMTDDCVFESTGPAPDGGRFEGRAAVREQWRKLFDETTDPRFHTEETLVAGDRAVVRWRYTWTGDDGGSGHVRGVDVIRIRDGKIAEKLSYVKG